MLYGEHAVIYDRPCIVTAVDLRIQATVTLSETDQVVIQVPDQLEPFRGSIRAVEAAASFPRPVRFVAVALQQFWRYTGQRFGVGITTHNQFTESYGLGSSSAVTIATLKALAGVINYKLDDDRLFKLGYETVRQVQAGLASGFDLAAAIYGGTLYFVTGGKKIEPLAVESLPLVICYTGAKAQTTEYVRRVKDLYQALPHLTESIMDNIARLVDQARPLLEAGDFEGAGRLMNINQGLLYALGVSVPPLNLFIDLAVLNGAYGTKLSGAGGGDCIIALTEPLYHTRLRVKLEKAIQYIPGAEILPLETGAPGVRIEERS